MTSWEIFGRCGLAVFLLLANAFFVATEFALTRLRQFPASEFESHRALRLAWLMTGELEVYLTACQVGITVMSVGLGLVAEPALATLFEGWLGTSVFASHGLAVVLSLAIINLLHIVVGEQLPTYLGIERAKDVARVFAPVHWVWTKIMWPIIWVADRATKAMLRTVGVEISRSWVHEVHPEAPKPKTRHATLRLRTVRTATRLPSWREEVRKTRDSSEFLHVDANGLVRALVRPPEHVPVIHTALPAEGAIGQIMACAAPRYALIGAGGLQGVIEAYRLLPHVDALRRGEIELATLARAVPKFDEQMPIKEALQRLNRDHSGIGGLASVWRGSTWIGWVLQRDLFEAVAKA